MRHCTLIRLSQQVIFCRYFSMHHDSWQSCNCGPHHGSRIQLAQSMDFWALLPGCVKVYWTSFHSYFSSKNVTLLYFPLCYFESHIFHGGFVNIAEFVIYSLKWFSLNYCIIGAFCFSGLQSSYSMRIPARCEGNMSIAMSSRVHRMSIVDARAADAFRSRSLSKNDHCAMAPLQQWIV